MIRLLTILLAFCTATIQAAPNKPQAMLELKKHTSYQEGAKAMADHLPDLAIRQFRATLADKKLSARAKSFATLALAEALIRSSIAGQGDDQQTSEALKLLATKDVKTLPSTPIWKAEALAAMGKYTDAEAALSKIVPSHPQHSEIQLSRARLLIALNRTDHALKLLKELNQTKSSQSAAARNSGQLLTAEIYLANGDFPSAWQTLEKIDTPTPTTAKLREYLSARIALAENKAPDAISQFRSLLTAPDNLSQKIYNACTLGLADAFIANKQNEEARTTLEDYITNHPNSAILQPVFQRLTPLIAPDLPADNPSMLKLSSWSADPPPAPNLLYIIGNTADAIRPYQPAPSEHNDLFNLSLYLRAQLLAQSTAPNKQNQALSLLSRLRLQSPSLSELPSEMSMKLASASLLDTAKIQIQQKNPKQAAFTLASMEKVAFSPRLKDQASLIRGLLLTNEGEYKDALAAFDFARDSTSNDIATAANINSGITALLSSNLLTFDKILKSTNNVPIQTALKLERALWKCRNHDISGRADLETFIMGHLKHPRENEARLALAAASVDISPPDIIQAKAQLDIIAPRLNDATSQYGITRIRIHADELSQNWTAAAATAEVFIRNFKDDPRIPGVILKQGEAYYHNEDFNKARQRFQQVSDQFPDSPFAPYARFYTAMAARLGGTIQSREESVTLFQKIILTKHPLAHEARIQQSRVLIDLRRYSEAEKTLQPMLSLKTISDSQHRDAGVLMADCLHRQGASNPQKYTQAIQIYDELLKAKDIPLAKKNQFHFLRGQTFESMNQRPKALDSYYSVVTKAHTPNGKEHIEIEWFWFYRCGFKALSMLETEQRWEAAVKLARRIANFDGPRSEEASKRASNLATQHMIWEEEKTPPQAIEIPINE